MRIGDVQQLVTDRGRSISTPRRSYSASSSAVRSARPSVAATKSTVSPRSRDPLDLGDPLLDAPAEFDRRLAGDVVTSGRPPSDSCRACFDPHRPSCSNRVALPSRSAISSHDVNRSSGRWSRGVFCFRFLVARPNLFDQLRRLRGHLFLFAHDERQIAIVRQVIEERGRSGFLGQRNDGRLIDRFDRALGRRVVPPDRLDVVADELDANRVVGAGREPVDDAAADAELAVLVDRILAREAGVGEQIAEHDRIEIHSGLQLDGGGLEAVRGAQPRQQRRAEAMTTRAVPLAIACSAPARADATPKCGAILRYGIDLQRGKRLDRFVERGRRRTLERGHEESRVGGEAVDILIASARRRRRAPSCDGSPEPRRRAPARTATARGRATAEPSMPVRAAAVLRSAWRLREVVAGIA